MEKLLVLFVFVSLGLTGNAQEDKGSKEIKVPIETLKSYVGKYELAPGAIIDVTVDTSRIFIQLTGQSKFEIFPSSISEFYLKVVEAKISFHSDEKGEISSLTLSQNGRDNFAKKIE